MNLIDLSCGLRWLSAYSGFLLSQKSTHVRSTTSSPVLLTVNYYPCKMESAHYAEFSLGFGIVLKQG